MIFVALALAGSSAAGAATIPFDSSPTITEATAADDEPAAEAIAETSPTDYNRDRATARAFEIIAERDRAHQRAKADEAASDADPLFKWEPAQIPSPPKIERQSAAPPLLPSQLRLGEPVGTEGPPPDDQRVGWLAGGMIVAAFLALAGMKWAEDRGVRRPRVRATARKLGIWRRRNSALLIVAGLAIVAASLTILKASNLPYEYRDYVRDGWLAFAGVAIALIGFYDKMKASTRSEI